MLRLRLVLLVIIILLPVQAVFAETLTANLDTNPRITHAKNLVHMKMRTYHYYNVRVFGDDAVFFAFHKKNGNIPFGWYRLNTKKRFSKAQRFLSSSEFSLLFQTAFSPDGKEAVVTSKTGEIIHIDLRNGKRESLGAFTADFGYSQYSYPTYTPDGQHIIFLDSWANSVLVINAKTKDISNGITVDGFWLPGSGGAETPESGSYLSLYQFSDDGKRMTFITGSVLNLETLTKE